MKAILWRVWSLTCLQTEAYVRTLDAITLAAEVLSSDLPAFVMLVADEAACELCSQLDAFWEQTASELHGSSWRVSCSLAPEVDLSPSLNECGRFFVAAKLGSFCCCIFSQQVCREITAGFDMQPGQPPLFAAKSTGPLFEVRGLRTFPRQGASERWRM